MERLNQKKQQLSISMANPIYYLHPDNTQGATKMLISMCNKALNENMNATLLISERSRAVLLSAGFTYEELSEITYTIKSVNKLLYGKSELNTAINRRLKSMLQFNSKPVDVIFFLGDNETKIKDLLTQYADDQLIVTINHSDGSHKLLLNYMDKWL